jgi:TolB protein
MKRTIFVILIMIISICFFVTGCGIKKKVKTYPLLFTTLIEDNQSIHTINEDSTHRLVMSRRDVWSLTPAWSPDAAWIAFASRNENEFYDLWVVRSDGAVTRKLTNNDLNCHSPAWSPDGRKLAYVATVNGKSRINLIDLTISTEDIFVKGETTLTDGGFDNADPRWSPDGRNILFISNRDGNPDIYVMQSSGSNIVNLTRNPANDDSASWSPDGTKILFRSERDGNQEIYTMNADGTGVKNLTRNPARDNSPVWSHDGRHILFITSRHMGETLYQMNANGGSPGYLASFDFKVRGPVWSPDDKRIALAGFTGTDWDIFILDTTAKKLTNITKTPINEFEPAWAPK